MSLVQWRDGAVDVAAASELSTGELLALIPILLSLAEQGEALPEGLPPEALHAARFIGMTVERVRQAARHDALAGARTVLSAVRQQGRRLAAAQQGVEDPDVLQHLHAVDHANAVAERRAVRLMILSGGWPAARTEPAPLIDVIRAGAAAVEGYERILFGGNLQLLTHPQAVGPLVAAVAELAENGLRAGTGPVGIEVGERTEDGSTWLMVTDPGPGMPAEVLATARQVLAAGGRRPSAAAWPGHGLRLVAAVTRALNLQVGLASSPDHGTRVSVLLPPHIVEHPALAPAAPEPN
ncbi:sensor histidine kinase [Kitasatospora sp. NPDC088783]|uniref:sensor histidine kinase n=1 Tax=Kitasatospora sp. NPDC088783 TaxID=3364077 RepID=UPI0037F10965